MEDATKTYDPKEEANKVKKCTKKTKLGQQCVFSSN